MASTTTQPRSSFYDDLSDDDAGSGDGGRCHVETIGHGLQLENAGVGSNDAIHGTNDRYWSGNDDVDWTSGAHDKDGRHGSGHDVRSGRKRRGGRGRTKQKKAQGAINEGKHHERSRTQGGDHDKAEEDKNGDSDEAQDAPHGTWREVLAGQMAKLAAREAKKKANEAKQAQERGEDRAPDGEQGMEEGKDADDRIYKRGYVMWNMWPCWEWRRWT